MKNLKFFAVLVPLILLFGCTPKKSLPLTWDYKVIEVVNQSDKEAMTDLLKKPYDTSGLSLDEQDAGEFYFDSTNADNDLSSLGDQGWELVSAVPQIETTHSGSGQSVLTIRTSKIILIFKRPAL